MSTQELINQCKADLKNLEKEYNAVNKKIRTRNKAGENADDLIAANYYNQTGINDLKQKIQDLTPNHTVHTDHNL